MRRIRLLLLVMTAVLMFTGCGSAQETTEVTEIVGSSVSLETSADEALSETDNAEATDIGDVEETEQTAGDETVSSDAGEELQLPAI